MRELYGWSIDLLNCCFNEARQYVTREVKRSGKERLHEVKWDNFFFFLKAVSVSCVKCVVERDMKWTGEKGIKGKKMNNLCCISWDNSTVIKPFHDLYWLKCPLSVKGKLLFWLTVAIEISGEAITWQWRFKDLPFKRSWHTYQKLWSAHRCF